MTAVEFIERYGTEKDVQDLAEMHYLCINEAQRTCVSMVIMERVINELNSKNENYETEKKFQRR